MKIKKKTSKALAKRVRVTRNGKLIRRPMGVGHSRTRDRQKNIREKKKTMGFNYPTKRIVNYNN